MVYDYNATAEEIVNFILQFNGKLPINSIHGNYDQKDFAYAIRENYGWSRMEWKKFIVKLKKENIIYIQKHKRDNYGSYINHWLDEKKLLEKYNVTVKKRNDNNITNRLTSYSLSQDLMGYADAKQCDDKHLLQIAINIIYKKAVSDKNDRHFTINSKGEMTYTPKGRLTAVSEDREKWLSDSKYRSVIKYGKGLKKIFSHQPIKISDSDIEYLTNKLKGKYTFTGKIKQVKGIDIREWYSGDKYARYNTESLGNSCMRHDSCQNYFDIYTENDDKVQMIIALDDEDMLIGRAILWNTDSHGLFCDRIYGTASTIEAIKAYAKKLGAYTKYEQSYSNTKLVSSTGEVNQNEITITLNKGGFDYYPYMDTLKYSDGLSNSDIVLSSDNGEYCLESTDGGPDNNYVTLHCGDRVHEDNARYINRYDEWYHIDDTVYSEHHGEDIVYDEAISIYDGNDYAWEDCNEFVFIDDEDAYYHTDEVVWSEFEQVYLHNYEECVIHGYIKESNSQVLEVNGSEYTCYKNLGVEDLLENGIITEEDYAEYQS